MKEKFPEFYVNFDELWKDAVFVFDTNVLLDILRMPKSERDSFIKILTELKKTNTVWLPFQVGLEYHNHYKEVIKENDFKVDEAKNNIKKELERIKDDICKKYNRGLVDIDTELIKTEIQKSIDAINIFFETANNSKTDYDKLTEEIANLFSDIGDDYNYSDKKEKKEKAEKRIKECIPPGFKDKNKDNGNDTGDILVWFQIIDYAKNNGKNIIFVTNDTKEDWFQKKGNITIMPRSELLKEFNDNTGKIIWIYSEDNFIREYNKNKNIPTNSKISSAEEEKLVRFMTLPQSSNTSILNACDFFNRTKNSKSPKIVYREHIDEMKVWFLQNYEDPANSCPFESKEGGYFYIYGGPYDAQEKLENEFGHIYNDEEIRIAAEELENEQGVWDWSGIPDDDDFQN